MEKVVAIEEARRKLGKLVVEVASSRQPIIIARRNSERAVLLAYEEYERLRARRLRWQRVDFTRLSSGFTRQLARPE